MNAPKAPAIARICIGPQNAQLPDGCKTNPWLSLESMQAVGSSAPTTQVIFVAVSFCPTLRGGKPRKTTERWARPAMPGDDIRSGHAVWITHDFYLGAPSASIVRGGGGDCGNIAFTQDSIAIAGVRAKTPAAPYSVGSHKPDHCAPGVTNGVGIGVNGINGFARTLSVPTRSLSTREA